MVLSIQGSIYLLMLLRILIERLFGERALATTYVAVCAGSDESAFIIATTRIIDSGWSNSSDEKVN